MSSTQTFSIGQRVRVYPQSDLLKRHRDYVGYIGTVDSLELDEDDRVTYRVKLDCELGQGYSYYPDELKEAAE